MKLAYLMSAAAGISENQTDNLCQLAKALDVPVTGIATSEDTLNHYVPVDGGYADFLTSSIEAAENNLKRCSEHFRKICEKNGVAQEWFGSIGFMHQEWEKLSAYFDLAVAAEPLSASDLATIGTTAVLQLNSTRPVAGFDGRALIAWDGSAPAARALKAALPILKRFAEIDVLIVDPKERTLPSDIGSYLASHGLKANILTEASGDQTTGRVILDAAKGSDLLVMGAYGLSATMEKWFGGVTETIKQNCNAPVLFAH